MIVDLTQAFYDVLAKDTTLTVMLATYNGLPAIFTDEEVPEDATLPYIATYGEISAIPDDNKIERGRQIVRDIRCYAPRNATELLDAMADRVVTLFHRQVMPISNARAIIQTAMGPVPGPSDDETIDGRIVSVRLRYVEVPPEKP
jgi:hypothetical protein